MTAHHNAFKSLCRQIIRSGEKPEDAPTPEELEFWENADSIDTHYGPEIVFIDEWQAEHGR